MAYEGEILTYTPSNLDFSVVYAVIVSGTFPNPCGHALLFVPSVYAISSSDGSYFQVAGLNDFPRIMSETGYLRYLRETEKEEITRYEVRIPNPDGAVKRLVEVMLKQWRWMILPHNCAAFVEDIVRGGGGSAGLYSNCPRLEAFR
ncbi:MAG: hypothetical protein WCJ26_02310 [bacterium]